MCTIYIEDEDQDVCVHCDNIEPAIPSLHDQVKVLFGDERGMTGTLINIDGPDGVIQVDGETLKLLRLRFLCKYQPL